MGDCFTASDAADFASKDTNRLVGSIAKNLAANSPFINVLGGGTFPSGVSDAVRSSVQLQAAPGDSLAIPTFTNDVSVCGDNGLEDKVSTHEYTYQLQSKRGRGPRVCVKQGYAAFKESYTRAEQSLANLVTQYVNADVKYQVYKQSGSKFVCTSGYTFNSLFTGGTESDLNQEFVNMAPNTQLTFAALHRIARHQREVLFAEPYANGNASGTHFRFIGSSEVIESFREESGVKDVLVALTNGSYKMGEVSLTGYSWDVAPAYRGIGFGIDQRPLRFNVFDNAGWPVLLDPVTVVVGSNGKAYAKASETWLKATYEIGILFAQNTFERLVPERYVGEGSFRFAPQLHSGELQWHYVVDNDCNTWGDYGWHKYQITRAYRPVRPQHATAIAYKRCEADLGLEACAVTGEEYTGEIL